MTIISGRPNTTSLLASDDYQHGRAAALSLPPLLTRPQCPTWCHRRPPSSQKKKDFDSRVTGRNNHCILLIVGVDAGWNQSWRRGRRSGRRRAIDLDRSSSCSSSLGRRTFVSTVGAGAPRRWCVFCLRRPFGWIEIILHPLHPRPTRLRPSSSSSSSRRRRTLSTGLGAAAPRRVGELCSMDRNHHQMSLHPKMNQTRTGVTFEV
jgi:hypothetical protein